MSAKDIHAFHRVPFEIYRNDPNWIPHLRQDVEKIFNSEKNKIFAEGGKARRWILRNEKGQLAGRVAAFVNPRTLQEGKLKAGGIGFFECVDEQLAADLLLNTGRKWLEEQGMEAMDGPVNFGDRNQFWGCQVSNWDEPGIYPMNYNPGYYSRLFENYGFGIYFKQFVYWRSMHEKAQPIFHRKYNQLRELEGFNVSNIRGRSLQQVAEDFRTVYNGAWGGHSHFKEMSSSAAAKIMKALKPALDPDIIIFAYYHKKPIAFYVNMPELNEIFKHVHGNLNLVGKLKFLYHKWKKTPRRMVGIVFGVTKEWQGKGVEAAMIVYAENTLLDNGHYQDTVLSWIGDFNPKMMKVAENLGTRVWRTYHTYRYQFNRELPFDRAPLVE